MNCKPGDLAIVVRSRSGTNIGKVVRCLRLLSMAEVVGIKTVDGRPADLSPATEWWQVDRAMSVYGIRTNKYFGDVFCYPDRNLRPLRPDEGEDETLTWAGKPNNVKEYAK